LARIADITSYIIVTR